jgi:AcrR family transcriptional regulator
VSESTWLLERLPAGNHGLPAQLVMESQRQRLTAAAAESLAERGYGAITVTEVVGRAGVSSGTFYKRFDGLWDCLLAAYEAGAERLCERVEVAGAVADGDPDGASTTVEAALALLASEPALANLLSAEPPTPAVALSAARLRLVERLATLLRAHRAAAEGPRSQFQPHSCGNCDREARLVAGALALVAMQVRAEGAARLGDLAPTLTWMLDPPQR